MVGDEIMGFDGGDAVGCKPVSGAAIGAAGGVACCGTCVSGAAAAGADGNGDDAGACVGQADFIVTRPNASTLSAVNLQSLQLL